MKQTKKWLLFFLSSILLSSCSLFNLFEEEEYRTSLPPVTQEGKNTFGCYVDGNLFARSYDKGLFANSPLLFSGFIDSTGVATSMFISCRNDNYERIHIRIPKGKFEVGKRTILKTDVLVYGGDDIYEYSYYKSESNYGNQKQYMFFASELDIVFHRFDDDVVAGEFSMKLYNVADTTSLLSITDGRFDLKNKHDFKLN